VRLNFFQAWKNGKKGELSKNMRLPERASLSREAEGYGTSVPFTSGKKPLDKKSAKTQDEVPCSSDESPGGRFAVYFLPYPQAVVGLCLRSSLMSPLPVMNAPRTKACLRGSKKRSRAYWPG